MVKGLVSAVKLVTTVRLAHPMGRVVVLAPIPLSVRSPRSLAGPVCALDSLAIAGPSLGLLLIEEIEIHCSDGRIGPRPTALSTQGSVRGGLTVGRVILSSRLTNM